jgi:hypothetical protein
MLQPVGGQVAEIESYVRTNAREVLGVDVNLFSISAKLALEAKLAARPDAPSVGPAAQQWMDVSSHSEGVRESLDWGGEDLTAEMPGQHPDSQ